MDRILIFGDSSSWVTTILLRATLREIQKADTMRVVSVCDAGLSTVRHYPVFLSHKIIRDRLIRLFNPEYRFHFKPPLLENLYSVARRFNVNVILPTKRNINHKDFIQFLKTDVRPTICLSYFCVQIFKKELLELFEKSVNYHNSLLPQYRGLAATSWSMFNGETNSGFTFHYMNEKIDDGNILHQDSIPILPQTSLPEVEYEKVCKAADSIDKVLKMLRRDDTGHAQQGTPSYFSWKDLVDITTIDDPSLHSLSELQRRLRAFGKLSIKIKGRMYRVTRLKKIIPSHPWFRFCLSFQTRDKIMVQPKRFLFLPLPLYLMYRLFVKLTRPVFG